MVRTMPSQIAIIVFCLVLIWLGVQQGSLFRILLNSFLRQTQVSEPQRRRMLLLTTALKHFAVFAVLFALLYTLQIFFGDAAPWLSK